MVYRVTTDEAKARLTQLIDAAIDGNVVVITKDDGEIVQLVPVARTDTHPRFGSGRGLMMMSKDFDEPLTDFEALTGGAMARSRNRSMTYCAVRHAF